MTTDERFMRRALDLAGLAQSEVSPNPKVGCVVVHNNKIIGEGYHMKYGEPHAEVNAIASVTNKKLLSESTVYVSLEPCAHFGKTPPCVDLLIKSKVARVVVCNTDPFPEVDGKGISKLLAAGIEVKTGVLAQEGERLNAAFFKGVRKQKPYVILKWAQSANGKVAGIKGEPIAISNAFSNIKSHQWRAEVDAIMVGTRTVLNDNPSLTTRNWQGNNPARVILDRNLSIPMSQKVFADNAKVFVVNEEKNESQGHIHWVQLDFTAPNFISQLISYLHEAKIRSILVEGGPRLHQLFLEAQEVDEIRIITSSVNIEQGINAPSDRASKKIMATESLKEDRIDYFY